MPLNKKYRCVYHNYVMTTCVHHNAVLVRLQSNYCTVVPQRENYNKILGVIKFDCHLTRRFHLLAMTTEQIMSNNFSYCAPLALAMASLKAAGTAVVAANKMQEAGKQGNNPWLHAWHDPVAGIKAYTPCIRLSNLSGVCLQGSGPTCTAGLIRPTCTMLAVRVVLAVTGGARRGWGFQAAGG